MHTGKDKNIKAAAAYALGIFPHISIIVAIVLLVTQKHDRFIRFHALQSLMVFGGILVLSWIIWLFHGSNTAQYLMSGLHVITVVAWILLMVKAYQGIYFKVPYIGDLVEKKLQKHQ